MVKSSILSKVRKLDHSFLNLSESRSSLNLKLLKKSYTMGQPHGNSVSQINTKKYYSKSDGLIALKSANLTVKTADCVPVFLYEKNKRIVAVIHAGWRGLLSGIIKNCCEQMKNCGAHTKNTIVAIGPHIGQCCYQVDRKFVEKFNNIVKPGRDFYKIQYGMHFVNLAFLVKYQLIQNGIVAENIDDVNICTKCNSEYASYRRDKTLSRNYSFITIQ